MKAVYTSRAVTELEAAHNWYEQQQREALGEEFLHELDAAVARIEAVKGGGCSPPAQDEPGACPGAGRSADSGPAWSRCLSFFMWASCAKAK